MEQGKKIQKRAEKRWDHVSFFRSEPFEPIWKAFINLSERDTSDEFKAYCEEIEGVEINKLKSKRSIYIRYALKEHVKRNIGKLKGEN